MSWDEIVGHQAQRDLLRGSIQRKRLSHTYLFAGPNGIGKRKFAIQLAQCLLCLTHPESDLEACGTCAGCKQVLARTHPDLFIVGCPEGKREIPVDTFIGSAEKRGKEGLCYDLAHTPMAGGRKIAIIADAELLNEEGSNSLLKTLEEPPPHSLMILLSDSTDSILQTIRSRCQIIRFNPLPTEVVTDLLLKNKLATDAQLAAEAAALSDGSVERASQLLDPELRTHRSHLYDLLAARQFNGVSIAKYLISTIESAGTETAAQREHAHRYFRFCINFFQTVMRELMQPEEGLIPQATQFRLRIKNPSLDHISSTANVIDRLIVATNHISQNTNVPLAVEACMDDVSRIIRTMPA